MNLHTRNRMRKASPVNLRLSLGSAIVLGLAEEKLEASPTTVYVMTYTQNKCTANCSFCPQARESLGPANMLSRVSWPVFQTDIVLKALQTAFRKGQARRVCIQALSYPQVFKDVVSIVKRIRQVCKVPISVSCQPVRADNVRRLAEAGVQRIGIPLDAATKRVFDEVKGPRAGGPYRWEKQIRMLKEALNIFGKGNVSTHLIVGLGEKEQEMIKTIQDCAEMDVLPALFAFTPIRGTKMQSVPQPPIQEYRRIQIARFLIWSGLSTYDSMHFDRAGRLIDFGVDNNLLKSIIDKGEAFLTSGCPDCNRPYYNERPSGPFYNHPRKLTRQELREIKRQVHLE